jgi:riboflavin biosynthesis pyrimidine reductase
VTAFEAPALDVLFERSGLPRFALPRELANAYGGDLGFDEQCLFANFVASVDGVVGLAGDDESGHVISQDSEADRFVMGLLRAYAEAVLIGAGTFRKTRGHLWHADAIYPAGAALFAETRRLLGLRPQPALALVTASGAVDPAEPALKDALIATSARGEARLRGKLPPSARLVVIESGRSGLEQLLALLRAEGARRVLTEGGPSILAELVSANLLDELFVTSSPSLFGRFPNDGRKALADGIDLAGTSLELLSVRRNGSHLFSRYSLRKIGD